MVKSAMNKWFVLVAFIGFSSNALSMERHVCSSSSAQRVIEVIYTFPEVAVPCEVKYTKNGESEILWRAESEKGYCEAKARELMEKHVSWGWSCS